MKVTHIELKDGIYSVTKSPNKIQKLFGLKDKVERYKTHGEVFKLFDNIKVFYRSDGSIVSPIDDICQKLNNFDRRF